MSALKIKKCDLNSYEIFLTRDRPSWGVYLGNIIAVDSLILPRLYFKDDLDLSV